MSIRCERFITIGDIPGPGPAWAGSVMGLSITASLVGIHIGTGPGTALMIIAAVALMVILTGLITETVRSRRAGVSDCLAVSFTMDALPAWSMTVMGILSLGSAADVNLGWRAVHLATLIPGVFAAVVIAGAQMTRLLSHRVPAVFPGVLPLVTPMVAATNAAQLDHPRYGLVLFTISLLTVIPAFIWVYLAGERHPVQPLAATTWIPLGVVGQSSAAAILLSGSLTGSPQLGEIYATLILLGGIPAAVWAAWVHWGSLTRLPWPVYGPAWWSSVFPVGTCALGTHLLSVACEITWLDALSAVLLALMCLHLLLSVTACFTTLTARWGDKSH